MIARAYGYIFLKMYESTKKFPNLAPSLAVEVYRYIKRGFCTKPLKPLKSVTT